MGSRRLIQLLLITNRRRAVKRKPALQKPRLRPKKPAKMPPNRQRIWKVSARRAKKKRRTAKARRSEASSLVKRKAKAHLARLNRVLTL